MSPHVRFPADRALCLVLACTLGGCERSGPQKPTALPPTAEKRADGSKPAPKPGSETAGQRDAADAPAAAPQAATSPAGGPGTSDSQSALPPGHPPIPAQSATGARPAVVGTAVTDSVLTLPGVKLAVPEGWVSRPATPGGMGPVAVFELPGSDGAGAAEVRITHFPNMKGMDQMNIDRWLGQVQTAEGQPISREDADISVDSRDGVTLTVVDVSGSVPSSGAMVDAGGGRIEDGRMIAAIIDHDLGPHYVKVLGPAATMGRWSDSILAFIHSAEATPP
ncbi:MAG: hypothetical protein C4547_02255 [Phycisphaerales bacterium]|nr:MAG: hypothetical protein C4547_02255 [Phycisphaerales bacterium]